MSIWCGWVLVSAAVLTPLLGWLGPLGFSALLTLMGLASLPALRIEKADRPVLAVLLAGLVWAAVSTHWSPFHPKNAGTSSLLKLALELPLYWAAICGARRADPALVRRAALVLAWGMAGFGLVLLTEAATGAAIYRWLHVAFYQPIRIDLAGKNIGQATFVLALLWPVVALAGARAGATPWLGLPMVVGVGAAAARFGFDAPALSLLLGPLAGLAAWLWPRAWPRLMAAKIAALFLAAPALFWAVRRLVGLEHLQAAVELSWAERMGYWSYAIDRIGEKPVLGWGLDASRTFQCCIQLHPHDGAIQVWLELGVVGAVVAAAFWWLALSRLSRPVRDPLAVALATSATAYLLFGAVNFGVWQEWWLALGAFTVVVAALAARTPRGSSVAVKPST